MVDIQFALSLLVLLGAWACWVKVSLDDCRDQLFDLREEMRSYFLERDLLSSALYAETRNLLNAMIRYTEQVSWVGLMVRSHRHPGEDKQIALDALLAKADSETAAKIQVWRKSAASAILIFLIEINPIALATALGYASVEVVRHGFHGLNEWRRDMAQQIMRPLITPAELELIARAYYLSRGSLRKLAGI